MNLSEQQSIHAGTGWAAFYGRLFQAQARRAPVGHAGGSRDTIASWQPDPVAPERRARDLVDREHSRPLGLSDLAAAAGLSRYHLIRRFAAAYGQTPMRYLAARRLERAGALLRTTELPVSEICQAVGYASLGSFGRAFRSRFGMAPRDFRAITPPIDPVPGCFAFMNGARDRATSE